MGISGFEKFFLAKLVGENGNSISDSNRLQVLSRDESLPILSTAGVLNALDSLVSLDVDSQKYRNVEFYFTDGNFVGIAGLYCAFNDPTLGLVWRQLSAKRIDGSASQFSTFTTTGGVFTYRTWRASIPLGAVKVAAYAVGYTSGSSNVVVKASKTEYSTVMTTDSLLAAGVNRVGFMARSAVWTRESTTPVNANLTITGAAKTTFATSSGTALNASTSYGDKFAAAAGANVVGTLIIDASPDSGTTYYPVASVALTQIGGAGNFGAYLETPIVEATMRARLVNGASNQANAYLTTKMLG